MARRPKPWYRKERQAWFVTLNGTQHNLGPEKSQAYERFYELMRQPTERRVAPQSMAAIVDEFLDWCSRHRAPDTYEWYRYRLQRFVERHPTLTVTEIRPFHVEKWASSYELSRTSRRNYLRAVKRCVKWAKRQGYIESNPIAELEVPAADRNESVLTQAEFDRLRAAVPDDCFRDLIDVTWQTGCRPQESLRVEARHLDAAQQRWIFPQSEAKGKRTMRIVYLTDESLAISIRLAERNPNGALFRNSNGSPWTKDAVGCAFNRIQIRFGKQEMKQQELSVPTEEIDGLIPQLKPTKRSRGRVIAKTEPDQTDESTGRQFGTSILALCVASFVGDASVGIGA